MKFASMATQAFVPKGNLTGQAHEASRPISLLSFDGQRARYAGGPDFKKKSGPAKPQSVGLAGFAHPR